MMVGCSIVSVVVCAVRSLGTHHDLYSSLVLFLYLCLLHGLRQILAGMVAEPAFLSEYTIFALDSSKQPKTQINSVVSPSTAFCIPVWGSKHLGSSKSHVVCHLPSLRASSVWCC